MSITPGIGLYYNVKTSPFTFGVHYNYIPNLRTIEFVEGLAKVTETQVSVSRRSVNGAAYFLQSRPSGRPPAGFPSYCHRVPAGARGDSTAGGWHD